jgi:hypothetical protein
LPSHEPDLRSCKKVDFMLYYYSYLATCASIYRRNCTRLTGFKVWDNCSLMFMEMLLGYWQFIL